MIFEMKFLIQKNLDLLFWMSLRELMFKTFLKAKKYELEHLFENSRWFFFALQNDGLKEFCFSSLFFSHMLCVLLRKAEAKWMDSCWRGFVCVFLSLDFPLPLLDLALFLFFSIAALNFIKKSLSQTDKLLPFSPFKAYSLYLVKKSR